MDVYYYKEDLLYIPGHHLYFPKLNLELIKHLSHWDGKELIEIPEDALKIDIKDYILERVALAYELWNNKKNINFELIEEALKKLGTLSAYEKRFSKLINDLFGKYLDEELNPNRPRFILITTV